MKTFTKDILNIINDSKTIKINFCLISRTFAELISLRIFG
jgi:hypothetical protein